MGLKVVIADDEAITRADLKERLQAKGYDVTGEAADGFDAIELCKRYQPDMVLLDIKMPMLDGLSAAKVIHQQKLCSCIVMMTAYSDSSFVKKAGELGVMGYVVKPVDDRQLFPTLEIALERSRELSGLARQLNQKEKQLEERKLIERAKGLLMESSHITEKEAYEYLRSVSMNKRSTLREVAEMIIMSHSNLGGQ